MQHWRINLVTIFFFLLAAIVIEQLFSIQVAEYGIWKARAQGQHISFSQLDGNRGEIFLEDKLSGAKIPLAINKDWEFVYVSPREMARNQVALEEVAQTLSLGLDLDKDLLLQKIQNSERDYELIKNKLSQEEVEFIKSANLPSVYLKTENIRYYPQEEFASRVIGFMGGEGTGQYGIEGYYNDILQGDDGFQTGERSASGFLIKMIKRNIDTGADLVLTLDYNIQFVAEKLLKEAKENLNFERGQIIVGDPNTGKIIAMAEFPSFNPNEYSKEKDIEIYQNSAIQKIFEPGSVFKPITMAVALDQQKITPETKYIDEGIVRIGGSTIENFAKKAWGERTMTEVLERSINTGAVFAQRQVGNQTFLKYLEKFGFFKSTGLDLQGEVFSTNSNLKKAYEINFATASFGQGIEITPIQLFSGISLIANGGKLIKPYVVEKVIENGIEIDKKPESSEEQVISQRAANQLAAMMVSVVENGYSKKAKIPGYYIAGKTGTSEVSYSALGINKPGYSDKTVQSFIGFAPAYNPKFLILIKLDNPKVLTAEYSATPIFHELSKYIIDLWQIPPDYEVEEKPDN